MYQIFLRKPRATCDFRGGGGCPDSPPFWISPCGGIKSMSPDVQLFTIKGANFHNSLHAGIFLHISFLSAFFFDNCFSPQNAGN